MPINYSVYGSVDSWIDCYYQQAALTNKNKKANFGDSQTTLAQGVTKGKLSYSEGIDNSLSYCGLGTECALSHISFIGVVNDTVSLINTQDRFNTNFAFFEKSNTEFYIPNANLDITAKNGFCWQSSTSSQNYVKSLEPMTLVNPHNMVLLIKVKAQTGINGATINVTLKQYLDTYKTTYPNILQVYIVAYFGNATTGRNTIADKGSPNNQVPFQLGLLDEYECEPKNLKFFMYSWYNNVVMGNYADTTYYGNDYFQIIACPDTAKENIKFSRYNTDYVDVHIDYYEEFEEDVLKSVACFGLYFTPDDTIIERGALTHNNMYIGIISDDGIGHGNYLRGADTANAPQAAEDYKDMHNIPYDPKKTDYDKTKYRNDTQFYDSALANGFTRFWVLGSSGVSQLLAELYNIMQEVDPDEPIEKYSQQVFLTNNPIDCVISLKKFPLQNVPSIVGPAFIQLGNKTTSIQASPLAKSCGVYYFTFSNGANTGLYPHFNKSFLDYEPYTTAKITVPFCGTVQIPATYFYDYGSVTVALVIDFISGACTGYIMANGITIDSVSGNCAITLPLSGIQSATLDSQIHSVAMAREKQQTTLGTGLIAGAVAIGVGIATGGVATAIGGAAAVIGSFMHAEDTGQQINYELSHMQTPLKQVAAASGQIAHSYDMRCKLLVTRPKILPGFGDEQQEEYANTIGFACLISSKVKDLHGFTVGTIDLDGVNCTAAEKEMIKNAFARGVYLK